MTNIFSSLIPLGITIHNFGACRLLQRRTQLLPKEASLALKLMP